MNLGNLSNHFECSLAGLLNMVGDSAHAVGTRAFLVGGTVRDLFLAFVGRSAVSGEDVDVMFESHLDEALVQLRLSLEKAVPTELFDSLKWRSYPEFLTAKVSLAPGVSCAALANELDFSQARRETYPSPGSHPLIKPGDLEADMLRRDFSINAICVSLSGESKGEVLDLCSGLGDLEKGILRVLHAKSFMDDPSRLLRAVRYKVRFGFCLEEETEDLFSCALRERYLDLLPKARLFFELKKAFSESCWPATVRELYRLGLLRQCLPSLDRCRPTDIDSCVDEIEEDACGLRDWRFVVAGLWRLANSSSFERDLKHYGLSKKAIDSILVLRGAKQ